MKRFLWLVLVVAVIAAACSGETDNNADDDTTETGTSGTDGGTDASDTVDGAATSEDTGSDTGDSSGESFLFDPYDDPRGEPFTTFQADFVRDDPFSSLDEFCVPHAAAADPEATDPGITEDSIQIHHIRQQLENLTGIGFGVDVGDTALMFEVFVDVINNECGGIRGRMLDLGLSEYDPLSPEVEQARVATCLEATEDRDSVIVLNSSGFQGAALLCIAEDHDTAIITTQGLSTDFYERGAGRLFSTQEGLSEAMTLVAETAIDRGALDDATVAVIGADTPGQPEAVAELVTTLTDAGVNVAVDQTLGCTGGTTCAEGLQTAVAAMGDAGVDAVFAPLNILSLPGLVSEMATLGFQPGDVTFFNGNANSQDGDLVSSKVAAFGGEAAAALYNGAQIVSASATGTFQLEDVEPQFNAMCTDTYAANGGVDHDFFSLEENTPAGMVGSVCAQVRAAARAIWRAGDNPTRADIYDALSNLGPMDINQMRPGSFTAGDQTAPDVAQTMTWTSPCELPDGAFDENDTCIVSNLDWFPAYQE
jgi:hypothetical protein